MELTSREFWTVIHGMLLGAVYLLAFTGGFAELWNLWKNGGDETSINRRIKRVMWGTWVMAVTCWLTVITGTFVVYPWYRAKTPDSPRSLLLADPLRAAWHTFGMEWKEHVAWMAPFLATAVAVWVTLYRKDLAKRREFLIWSMIFFFLAFITAAVAGVFGAFLNKVAPIV